MDVSNPVFFIFDCVKMVAERLDQFEFLGISYLIWIFAFIIVGMVVSVFWRGARG